MSSPNTNPLTYNLYVQQVANMAIVDVTTVNGVLIGDASWETLVPSMLNYAELRIQRDLDLLPLLTSSNYATVPGNNILSISSNDFVTVQTVAVVVSGVTYTLLPTSKEFIQNVWGDTSVRGQPTVFAMYGGDMATGGNVSNNILMGPCPDNNYFVSITGTIRAPSLYLNANTANAATATTFISTYFPDLLVQASLVYISQFQRNFLPTSNDPEMPGSYEAQYQSLLRGATVEEARKKFQASAWSSMSPPVAASPTR